MKNQIIVAMDMEIIDGIRLIEKLRRSDKVYGYKVGGALCNKETDHLNNGFGREKKKKDNVYNLETYRSDGSERSDTDWI